MLNRRTLVSLAALGARRISAAGGRTAVSIRGDAFLINGRPTYAGREYKGNKIEGLLMNSRVVQGIFDDSNPETRERWRYPDTGKWDPERNTREFIAAMPTWRAHGLLAFTINLQGGSPEGYSKGQPWRNSAIDPDGSLRADYMGRLERILSKADELGMVAVVGIPKSSVVSASDYVLEHANVVFDEAAITEMIAQTKKVPGYRTMPILFS